MSGTLNMPKGSIKKKHLSWLDYVRPTEPYRGYLSEFYPSYLNFCGSVTLLVTLPELL